MPSDAEATRRWLNDIRHHIATAEAFVGNMTHEAFGDDLRTPYAATRVSKSFPQPPGDCLVN